METSMDPVNEVRAWREQVSEAWKGKRWEEIERELDERAERMEREIEQGRFLKKKTDAA